MKELTINQVMNGFTVTEDTDDDDIREWVFATKEEMQKFVDAFFAPAVASASGKGLSALSPKTLKAIGENIMSRNSFIQRLNNLYSAPPPAEPVPLCATECNCTNFKPGTLRFNQDAVNCLYCGGWMSGLRTNIDMAAPCSADHAIEATQALQELEPETNFQSSRKLMELVEKRMKMAEERMRNSPELKEMLNQQIYCDSNSNSALQELTAEAEAMGGYGGASPTNAWTEEAQAVRSQVDAANLESAPKDISEITASLIKRQGL